MTAICVFTVLIGIFGLISSDPVGQCDPNRISNQYLRDDSNACAFYQCEYHGTSYLRPTFHACAPGTKVPEKYGESAAYPDSSNPCVLRVWNPADCRPRPFWSPWGDWSACSKTCGTGVATRERQCNNGPGCQGAGTETRSCTNSQSCCPPGFAVFGNSCYSFITVSGRSPSWALSRAICQNASADLVSIETSEEHEFIKNNLRPITPPNRFIGWYVGGRRLSINPVTTRTGAPVNSREARKLQFFWVPTGQQVAYDGWTKAAGVPGDYQPDGNGPCMVLWIGRRDFVDYEFDDYSCNGNVGGYVCEKALV
ncbi:A disintegrin and metalloproteinase with thrombospondin motifs adt-2 [Lingula anatina]|uniref:A disintegrin and metalloproteinase with thrombospondin motifs adt-2 n=1 Tax=Lingula anatina TaxID=7574 RepID=A0A1S3IVF0_LINAN|nr:A disintegrin and metalloproteinase with thrombospondin motifs adt-2 [Lingula anatina]|eukprot:XP_013402167.1 A disintegrin and metalloproteinase with thrombospondin motifs adt-2 [Lingula anatina]